MTVLVLKGFEILGASRSTDREGELKKETQKRKKGREKFEEKKHSEEEKQCPFEAS